MSDDSFLNTIEKNKEILVNQLDALATKYKDQVDELILQRDKVTNQSVIAIKQKLESAKLTRQAIKDKEAIEKQSKEISELSNALDVSSIVAITDIDGTITYVNDEFCRISKYSQEELLGQNHRILQSGHHTPEFFENLYKKISSGNVWRGDIKNRAKDGTFYWVKTTINPLLDINGIPEKYIAIRTEITKEKKLETELMESIEKSKEVDKLKEEFMTMVSHELKTPLTPIKLWTTALNSSKMGTLNPMQQKALDSISSSVNDLSDLVSDIFDSYKLDLNQMKINCEEIDIKNIMKKIHDSSIKSANELKIKFENSTNTNGVIFSDSKRLIQILRNLINNALDFVAPNTGIIEINATLQSDSVLFYVKDNGIGIPKEHQDKLFMKFYQVDTTSTRHHGGSGLGLSICNSLVNAMNGKIWVDSIVGKGTTFYMSFPLKQLTTDSKKTLNVLPITS